MNRARTLGPVLALTAGLAVAARGIAHDFWLIPEFFSVPAGWSLHVYANTGESFPESMAALAADRVASARLIGAHREAPIERMRRLGHSLALEVVPPEPGQWYVALEVKPRRIDLSAEEFNEYLVHDGLPHILEIRRARGELDRPGRERYSRGAKALVQVGEEGPTAWDRPIGHAIELIPLADPSRLAPGDTLAVRLLFRGDPVEGAIVSAGHAGSAAGHEHTSDDSGQAADHEHGPHTSEAVTDGSGTARLAISRAGRWYVRTIHMIERREDPEIDWESFWATLTFEVVDPERAG